MVTKYITNFMYLKRGEVVIDEEGQSSDGNNQELGPEGVMVVVVSSLELDVYQINGSIGTEYIDDFHGRIVDRDEASE